MTSKIHYNFRTEFGTLKEVLLYKPAAEMRLLFSPAQVLYLDTVDFSLLNKEYDALVAAYNGLGIKTHFINPDLLPPEDELSRYNLMYTRDLIFMTPFGAIIGNMAFTVRKKEVIYARQTLESMGIPIFGEIGGNGTFEGADALWIHDKLVIVGTGKRTNKDGFDQFRGMLNSHGIECVSIPLHESPVPQHLLGEVQIVDKDFAVVRTKLAKEELTNLLTGHGINVLELPENNEVTSKQAMNFVTINPGRIIMTAGCPETRRIYEAAGIEIAAEVEIAELIKGGGGIACATAILLRDNCVEKCK
jgi:N-dimethylarginine dimethylaminohydrolase